MATFREDDKERLWTEDEDQLLETDFLRTQSQNWAEAAPGQSAGSQGGCQIEEDINLINVHCCNIRYVLQRESIQLHPLNMLLGRQLGKLELSLHSLRHHLNKRLEYEKKVMRKFPKISQSRRRPLLGPSPG